MKSNNCIISFANSKNLYVQRLARLSDSLRNNFDGDFLSFIGEASCGAESHESVPYGFKIHCFKKAMDAGYQNILWLDTSVFAIAPVQPIFDRIEEKGFVFQDAGHFLGTWCNDFTLEYFGITRDSAMNMRMIGNAGFLGLNVQSHKAMEFFRAWDLSMFMGCFEGEWSNQLKTESDDERCLGHRHDMSASSAIIHKMGLFDLAYGGEEVLQYAGLYDKVLNETIILKAQG